MQAQKTGDEYIIFLYDENGTAYGLIVRNGEQETTYYYTFNLQGDIIGILDSSGNVVVNYTYTAWGEIESITGSLADSIGQQNPIRYRGYYYDSETGFYYLQSRYYDPITQRFLNADGVTDGGAGVIGNNLFTYAANNPVNNSDPSGHWIIKNAFKKIVKSVMKNTVKPVINAVKKVLPKIVKGTTQIGVTASGAFGVNVVTSVGIAYDGKGNVGFSVTGGGGSGTPSASACIYSTKTNAQTIDKLEGLSGQIGGSVDILGINAGVEMTTFADSISNTTYLGSTSLVGVGAPIPAELHGDITYTKVYYINIFEKIDMLYDRIMRW